MDDELATSQVNDEGAALDESTSEEEVIDQSTDESQEETTDTEETSEEQSEEATEEEEDLSNRQQKRIDQIKPLKLNSLLERIKTPQSKYTPPNLRDRIEADDAIIEDLESINTQAYSEGLRQANSIRVHTQLEIDGPKAASKYPILDQDSNEFNPAVADTLNNLYLDRVGYDPKTDTFSDPNVRYLPFMDAIMELVDTVASNKVQESRKNIAQQASNTGIRPNGTAAKAYTGDDPSKMTNEQLSAMISKSLK